MNQCFIRTNQCFIRDRTLKKRAKNSNRDILPFHEKYELILNLMAATHRKKVGKEATKVSGTGVVCCS